MWKTIRPKERFFRVSVDNCFGRMNDADEVFVRMKEKQLHGEELTKEDYAILSLTPLMSGSMQMKDKIREAIILAKRNTDLTAEKTTAMLYTLADKFLDNADLDEIKEVVAMTRIGQMLLDEGMERGMECGMERGMEQGMQLTQYLLDNNRTEDLKRAVKDEAYRKKLLEELNSQG